MKILMCSACLKMFNGDKCNAGGTFNGKFEYFCCPHCHYMHAQSMLLDEQKSLREYYQKNVKHFS